MFTESFYLVPQKITKKEQETYGAILCLLAFGYEYLRVHVNTAWQSTWFTILIILITINYSKSIIWLSRMLHSVKIP